MDDNVTDGRTRRRRTSATPKHAPLALAPDDVRGAWEQAGEQHTNTAWMSRAAWMLDRQYPLLVRLRNLVAVEVLRVPTRYSAVDPLRDQNQHVGTVELYEQVV